MTRAPRPHGLSWIPSWGWYVTESVGIAFFGFCFLYALVRLVRRTPLLVVDDDGILDQGSALRIGRLRWSEVSGVEVRSFLGQRFLSIRLLDPSSVVARQPRVLRFLFRFNHRVTGSPVCIPASVLPASAEVVRDRIEAFRLRVQAR
jgi:hypothetical protein